MVLGILLAAFGVNFRCSIYQHDLGDVIRAEQRVVEIDLNLHARLQGRGGGVRFIAPELGDL